MLTCYNIINDNRGFAYTFFYTENEKCVWRGVGVQREKAGRGGGAERGGGGAEREEDKDVSAAWQPVFASALSAQFSL